MLPGHVVRGRKNPLHQGLPLRLKEARIAAGLTCRQLAERAGLSNPVVAYIEAGRVPGVDTVERIAVALDVAPCWLAYGEEGSMPFQQKVKGRVLREGGHPSCAAWGQEPVEGGDGARHERLSERLRLAREKQGLARKALGRAAGIPNSTILNYEEGRTVPGVDRVERLALALVISPCWLAFGSGYGPLGLI